MSSAGSAGPRWAGRVIVLGAGGLRDPMVPALLILGETRGWAGRRGAAWRGTALAAITTRAATARAGDP